MLWNVEEHRYGLSQEKHELKRELSSPLSTAVAEELSFLQKFWELQSKMLTVRSHEQEHKYSSTALQWLTLDTSIAYWMHPKSNAQIHLLPNSVIWGSSSLALIAYLVTLIFYLLRRRRCIYDIPEGLWEQFSITGWVLAGGWMFNFLPYLLTDKPLFLYHYLPAATLQTLLIPAMLSHFADCFLRSKISRHLLTALTLAILASAIQNHRMLCPLSLGFPPLQSHELAQLQELHSWELLIRQQRTPGYSLQNNTSD
uniref:Protein O-mannosyl-transferase C-terminal four TM domain-containing protein n=1 Tax=Eptatretus burgeri TaxID=7764 RepID=A0A8C4Q7B9_EPTBU